jgi:hypothetical protein
MNEPEVVVPQSTEAKPEAHTTIEFFVPILIFFGVLAIFLHTEGIFRITDVPSYVRTILAPQAVGPSMGISDDARYPDPVGQDVSVGDEGVMMPDDMPAEDVYAFPTLQSSGEDYASYYQNLRTQEGVTWLAQPEPLRALGLVSGWWNASTNASPIELMYFKIGDDRGKAIIITFLPCDGICFVSNSSWLVFKEGVTPGTYEVLTRHTPSVDWSQVNSTAPDVWPGIVFSHTQQNNTDAYENLVPPLNLNDVLVGKQGSLTKSQAVSPYDFSANTALNPLRKKEGEGSIATDVEFVQDTLYGPLFRIKRASISFEETDPFETGRTQLATYLLRLPGGVVIRYNEQLSFMGDDGVPQFVWSDGTKNTDPYRADGRASCGAMGAVEVVSKDDATRLADEIVQIGSTNTGEPVYGVVNPSHWLVTVVFGEDARQRYNTATGEMEAVRVDEFLSAKGLVLYKDAFGQYVVLMNTRFGGGAECGKPVIYLYPETTTAVSVAVGAEITKSTPRYRDGWEVVAEPDGTLTHEEGTFDSLYWDGIGHGSYPAIDRGFIVKRDDVEATLTDHLAQLGFIDHEIEDFLEYWMPLMPDTPYVRLTWLGTHDMNALAPLTIAPKPDTLIRAFLDFEGVARPYYLPSQRLSAIPRVGFTAVEWGGLLR